MGLDMYLDRHPRYKGATPSEINAAESFIEWQRDSLPGGIAENYTFQAWTGREADPDPDLVRFVGENLKTTYYAWDVEKRHPRIGVSEQVGYWRKANAIHQWFVENVQEGVDDCNYWREVTVEDLIELRELCIECLEHRNSAHKLLPTTHGFFFGCTDYDDWYFSDLEKTIEICNKAIETTDFETHMLHYVSSW